jgi:hypothetical protein
MMLGTRLVRAPLVIRLEVSQLSTGTGWLTYPPRVIGSDTPGLRLSGQYFLEVVAPLVASAAPGLRYGAALIGSGSEVLGFDTEMSADHGYGPRVVLFLEPVARPAVAAALEAGLPAEFEGMPTRFHRIEGAPGDPPHQVVLTDVASWSIRHLGLDVTARPLRPVDWLGLPWQRLAEATGGAVFRDDDGTVTAMRSRLAWYPDDLWRYVLACQWLRIAQEEPFVGRAGIVGDDLGSAVVAARLVRDVMQLAFLLGRRWAPYSKWLGSAFAQLPGYQSVVPMLQRVLRAEDWHAREAGLCEAYEYCARMQSSLGLAAPVDPRCRPFYSRPFRVLDAKRFTRALINAITDPGIAALPRAGGIDAFADSTDLLTNPRGSAAAAAAVLGRG